MSDQAPSDKRKIRVGALGVGEYNFWPIWADVLAQDGPFTNGLLNMQVTHCWDVKPQLARQFADKYGCVSVDKYDGMIGQVDAIALGGFYEIPWQHRLAEPYLKTGVPAFLNRPFAYSLRGIDHILELAAKHNTPLMATSVQEHYYQASLLKERLANVGVIKSVHGIGNSTEYAGHFHVQWFILRALGYDVEQVALHTDDDRQLTYLQQTMLFKGGDGQPPYLASLHAADDIGHLYLKVIGDKGSETVTVDRSPNRIETLYHYFAPQLVDMQRTFEGHPCQPFDVIRKKTQIFLAGYYSHLEKNGALVMVDSVPTDWSPPPFIPDYVDESIFN